MLYLGEISKRKENVKTNNYNMEDSTEVILFYSSFSEALVMGTGTLPSLVPGFLIPSLGFFFFFKNYKGFDILVILASQHASLLQGHSHVRDSLSTF